jgi:hypothetical protein
MFVRRLASVSLVEVSLLVVLASFSSGALAQNGVARKN